MWNGFFLAFYFFIDKYFQWNLSALIKLSILCLICIFSMRCNGYTKLSTSIACLLMVCIYDIIQFLINDNSSFPLYYQLARGFCQKRKYILCNPHDILTHNDLGKHRYMYCKTKDSFICDSQHFLYFYILGVIVFVICMLYSGTYVSLMMLSKFCKWAFFTLFTIVHY